MVTASTLEVAGIDPIGVCQSSSHVDTSGMFKSSLFALSTVVQLLSMLGIDDDEINLTFYNTSTEMICR